MLGQGIPYPYPGATLSIRMLLGVEARCRTMLFRHVSFPAVLNCIAALPTFNFIACGRMPWAIPWTFRKRVSAMLSPSAVARLFYKRAVDGIIRERMKDVSEPISDDWYIPFEIVYPLIISNDALAQVPPEDRLQRVAEWASDHASAAGPYYSAFTATEAPADGGSPVVELTSRNCPIGATWSDGVFGPFAMESFILACEAERANLEKASMWGGVGTRCRCSHRFSNFTAATTDKAGASPRLTRRRALMSLLQPPQDPPNLVRCTFLWAMPTGIEDVLRILRRAQTKAGAVAWRRRGGTDALVRFADRLILSLPGVNSLELTTSRRTVPISLHGTFSVSKITLALTEQRQKSLNSAELSKKGDSLLPFTPTLSKVDTITVDKSQNVTANILSAPSPNSQEPCSASQSNIAEPYSVSQSNIVQITAEALTPTSEDSDLHCCVKLILTVDISATKNGWGMEPSIAAGELVSIISFAGVGLHVEPDNQ